MRAQADAMGSVKQWVVLATVWMLLTLVPGAPASAAEPAPEPSPPPSPMAAEGAALTSFYFGKGNQITPIPPYNESGGQTALAPGVSVPRALVGVVGTWSVGIVEEQMALDSLEGMSIWASSDFGATNVRFIVIVQVNGNQVASLTTDTKATLSSAPAEFLLDPNSANFGPRVLEKGTQLSFTIQYAASAARGIGPSADSTFHFYGNLFRSRVDFITNPFNLTIVETRRDVGNVNVTTIVKDAFGVPPDQKILDLSFSGPSTSQPQFVRLVSTVEDSINGTTITWNWDYAAQGSVGSGVYTVTVSAKYLGSDLNYTASNISDIKFPKVEEAGGFLPGPGAAAALGAVALVAVVAGASRAAGKRRR